MLLLRVVTGLIFIHEGWTKIENMAGTRMLFAHLHLWLWLAPVVTWAEFLGGIALLLGVWTCLFSTILIIDMLGVLVFATSWTRGLFSSQYVFLLIAALLAIKSVGPGKWKLGMKGGCGCMVCKNKQEVV